MNEAESVQIGPKYLGLTIVPGKTDADYAADVRRRMVEAAAPIFAIMDEVIAAGLNLNFQVGQHAVSKKHEFTALVVSKTL